MLLVAAVGGCCRASAVSCCCGPGIEQDHFFKVAQRLFYLVADGHMTGAIAQGDGLVTQALFEVKSYHVLPGGRQVGNDFLNGFYALAEALLCVFGGLFVLILLLRLKDFGIIGAMNIFLPEAITGIAVPVGAGPFYGEADEAEDMGHTLHAIAQEPGFEVGILDDGAKFKGIIEVLVAMPVHDFMGMAVDVLQGFFIALFEAMEPMEVLCGVIKYSEGHVSGLSG